MEYFFIESSEDEYRELIDMSIELEKEGCSYGMVSNTKDDINSPILVAKENDKIIGYIFGHEYLEDTKRSYINIGAKCFMIDELYVSKAYRNKGIGKKLFKMFEEVVTSKYEYVTLSTSTKDYKKILGFYVDELGMNFHSAFLIKKISK